MHRQLQDQFAAAEVQIASVKREHRIAARTKDDLILKLQNELSSQAHRLREVLEREQLAKLEISQMSQQNQEKSSQLEEVRAELKDQKAKSRPRQRRRSSLDMEACLLHAQAAAVTDLESSVRALQVELACKNTEVDVERAAALVELKASRTEAAKIESVRISLQQATSVAHAELMQTKDLLKHSERLLHERDAQLAVFQSAADQIAQTALVLHSNLCSQRGVFEAELTAVAAKPLELETEWLVERNKQLERALQNSEEQLKAALHDLDTSRAHTEIQVDRVLTEAAQAMQHTLAANAQQAVNQAAKYAQDVASACEAVTQKDAEIVLLQQKLRTGEMAHCHQYSSLVERVGTLHSGNEGVWTEAHEHELQNLRLDHLCDQHDLLGAEKNS